MLLSGCVLSNAIAADPPAEPATVNIETFKGPKPLSGVTGNVYPQSEGMDGREGWVVLNTMIDPQGKPYEAMVLDSSSNPAFEGGTQAPSIR